jgi:hypothetical protein
VPTFSRYGRGDKSAESNAKTNTTNSSSITPILEAAWHEQLIEALYTDAQQFIGARSSRVVT